MDFSTGIFEFYSKRHVWNRKLDIRNIWTWVHMNWFSVYTSFWNVYCTWSWSGNKTKNSALILHKHLNKPAFTWPVFKKLIFQRILASNLLRIKIYKTEGHCGKGVSQQCLIFWSIKSALQKTSKNIKKENIYHLHIILACSCKPWLLWDYVKPTLFFCSYWLPTIWYGTN